MNELRMYVEHLFEGKVLTSENIDLKEEIYGNLMARYEDLLADGIAEDEALRRTMESMTNIDDVLEGASFDSASACEGTRAEETENESKIGSDGACGVNESVDDGACDSAPADDDEELFVPGGPTPVIEGVGGQPEHVRATGKRTWLYVAAGALIAAALFGIGFSGCSLVLGLRPFDAATNGRTSKAENLTGGDGSADATDPHAEDVGARPAPTKANSEIFTDENGQIWIDGELGNELTAEVVAAGYDVVAEYADTDPGDAAKVEALLRSLPMSAYVGAIDVTKGVDVLSFAYREVPEAYGGDSIDAALAYDVTALFCAMPLLNEVQVTLTESDEPQDEEYYVFKRDDVQNRYGVRLDGQMVNEAGWHQIKNDNLYRRKFIDNMVDAAEREGK